MNATKKHNQDYLKNTNKNRPQNTILELNEWDTYYYLDSSLVIIGGGGEGVPFELDKTQFLVIV